MMMIYEIKSTRSDYSTLVVAEDIIDAIKKYMKEKGAKEYDITSVVLYSGDKEVLI